MTLFETIMKKVQSAENLMSRNCYSPPPENSLIKIHKKKKRACGYTHIGAAVDSSPPPYYAHRHLASFDQWRREMMKTTAQNIQLVVDIRRAHTRGKVECHWDKPPPPSKVYYDHRVNSLRRIASENKLIYQRIITTAPRVASAASLRLAWRRNRREIVRRARAAFVLFPPVPRQHIEDPIFRTPEGVKRPRVHVALRVRGGAALGELLVELFVERCPATCRLFLDLLHGDGLGHGYVGTTFFRKVPHLYWSGGDVVHDSGFGCYAQRGRAVPIGAENYHFPHSMPGLLSMRVTRDDEVCGIFNITFKPLPQFDLVNVVFGRVIRPNATYDVISVLGSALGPRPVVEIGGTRRGAGGRAVCGAPNTKLVK